MNIRWRTVLALSFAMAAAPESANAALLQAATPAFGETIPSTHPVFTWTQSGAHANTITISRSLRTTTEGAFYDEDYVTGDAITGNATSWQPTGAIPAGEYYWNVSWYADDYSTSGYTSAREFSIPAALTFLKISATRYRYLREIDFTAKFVGNTDGATARCAIRRGHKVIWKRKVRAMGVTPDAQSTARCEYTAGSKIRAGERLSLTVTVQALEASRSKRIVFRAP